MRTHKIYVEATAIEFISWNHSDEQCWNYVFNQPKNTELGGIIAVTAEKNTLNSRREKGVCFWLRGYWHMACAHSAQGQHPWQGWVPCCWVGREPCALGSKPICQQGTGSLLAGGFTLVSIGARLLNPTHPPAGNPPMSGVLPLCTVGTCQQPQSIRSTLPPLISDALVLNWSGRN